MTGYIFIISDLVPVITAKSHVYTLLLLLYIYILCSICSANFFVDDVIELHLIEKLG